MIRYESGRNEIFNQESSLILFRQRILADIKPDMKYGT